MCRASPPIVDNKYYSLTETAQREQDKKRGVRPGARLARRLAKERYMAWAIAAYLAEEQEPDQQDHQHEANRAGLREVDCPTEQREDHQDDQDQDCYRDDIHKQRLCVMRDLDCGHPG